MAKLTSAYGSITDPTNPGYIYLGDPQGISAYADQQTDAANTFLLRLADTAQQLAAPAISPEFPTDTGAPAVTMPDAPSFTYPVWTSPAIPAAFTQVLETGDLEVEPFDEDPPSLTFGSAPADFAEALPEAPAVNLTYDDPTLDVSLPAAPNLLSISIQPFDGLNLPTFDAEEPVLTAVAPSIREYQPGDPYTSALLTSLQTSLRSRIEEGGSGLGQNAETAIWDRGREREMRSKRDALDGLDQMEELGYALPPGAYANARIKIETETDYASRGHSREVMIESARLELENVKHALTTATSLESRLIDYSNSVEQRLFEATRYATEAGVQIYNAKVQAYAGLVDVYRAKVGAYEARIRAETSRVDAYRAQVDAEQAKAQVNVALVEQYKAQIEAALSNIRIYEAEIRGIQTKADIEKTKVEVFGEQVRGYVAQVNAYTAGVEGYRARLGAEETKQRVYASTVDAYRARVDASARGIEARVAAFRGQIDAKNAEWTGYRAQAEAEASRVQSIASINNAKADAYRAEVTGMASYNEVLTSQWKARLDLNERVAEIAIQAAKANAELYITTRNLATDAAKVGATVSAQLGAAAINAINWSQSFSESKSFSGSNAFSYSVANSDSYSENFNYNYSG